MPCAVAQTNANSTSVYWDGATVSTSALPQVPVITGDWFNSWSEVPNVPSSRGQTVLVPHKLMLKVMMSPAGQLLVPAGEFDMGNPYPFEGTPDELPVHRVKVRSFFMDKYEVPFFLWRRVRLWALTNGYADLGPGLCGYSVNNNRLSTEHPVVGVSWHDAVQWCNARSEYEGYTPVYFTDSIQTNVYRRGYENIDNTCVDWSADGYRLPTEAEWEYVARGTFAGRRFPMGDVFVSSTLNGADSGDPFDNGTTPIGFYHDKPNEFGFYDFIGNAIEWCWDWYGQYPDGPVDSPHGPLSGQYRVLRGGSWKGSFSFFFRNSYRHYFKPYGTDPTFGFRCCRRF